MVTAATALVLWAPLALLATRVHVENQVKRDEMVSLVTQAYPVLREKGGYLVRRARGVPQELEPEDREVKMDHLAHQASPELALQDLLAPLGLVVRLVVTVTQGSGVHLGLLATAIHPSVLVFLTMEEDSQVKQHGNNYAALLTIT